MPPASDSEQLTARLRSIADDGGSIEAAQVKVIGLDEIREAAGARWPRMRERVRTGSFAILSQHIGPEDVIIPAGDGFLVILAEGRPGDTQRRCQAMQDALLAFYLGEETLSALRPQVQKRTLAPEGLTDLLEASASLERPAKAGPGDGVALAPVVSPREPRVAALLSTPAQRGRDGRRIVYDPEFILDGRHHDQRAFCDLDLMVLETAASAMHRHAGPLGATVHSSTLQKRRTRDAYLRWVRGVDIEHRRRLFVSIMEIERGTPLISIAEWCASLRALGVQVCLDFHYSDHAIASIGAAGAWGAGFQLPAFVRAQQGWRAERLREHIEFWAKSVRGQGMRLLVHGFTDAAFLESAHGMGVDLLTSDRHWPFGDGDLLSLPLPDAAFASTV